MEAWLVHLGYLGVFIGVGMESAGIPLPGETILVTTAALAAHGRLSAPAVAAVAFAAAVLGDNLGFFIGRKGGRPLLERWTGRLHAEGLLPRLERFFQRFGPAAVCFARFLPGLRVLAPLSAGASQQMSWRRFLVFNVLGAAAWVSWAVAIGYYGYVALEHSVGASRAISVMLGVGVAAVVLGAFYWAFRLSKGGRRASSGD